MTKPSIMTDEAKANWEKVIAFLEWEEENEGIEFSMLSWNCGSVACIGGSAEICYMRAKEILGKDKYEIDDQLRTSETELDEWLGISSRTSHYLFWCSDVHDEHNVSWGETTRKDAIKAIRNVMNGATEKEEIWGEVCRDMAQRLGRVKEKL